MGNELAGTPARVGMASVDAEHDRLFGLLGELDRAVRAGEPGPVQVELLQRTAEYMSFHFDGEEQFLGIVAYPRFAQHRAEHAKLREALAALGTASLSAGRVAYVWAALCRHVDTADRAYVAWLASP